MIGIMDMTDWPDKAKALVELAIEITKLIILLIELRRKMKERE